MIFTFHLYNNYFRFKTLFTYYATKKEKNRNKNKKNHKFFDEDFQNFIASFFRLKKFFN